jgi:hypothetical protein
MFKINLGLNSILKPKKETLYTREEIAKIAFPDFELFKVQWDWLKEIYESPEEIVEFLGARGYGKTDIITILGLVLEIYFDRKFTCIVTTREFSRAKDIVYAIGIILNDLKVKGKYSRTQIRTLENSGNKQPTLRAMSTGSATKGHHVDILVMDDPVEPKDEDSEKYKKRARKFFDEAKSLRINGRKFKLIIIGQYVSEDDLYTHLENPDSDAKILKAWHGTIPELDIDKEKYLKTSSIREFGKNYEGKFYRNEDALFTLTSDHFFKESEHKLFNTIAFLDPSYSQNGDYSAFVVANWENGRCYVKGYLFRNMAKVYENLDSLVKQHRIRQIYYDANLDKELSFMKRTQTHLLQVFPFNEKTNKEQKILEQLNWALGMNKVLISEETGKEFISQISTYAGRDSSHDDAPDVLACLIRYLRKEKRI